MIRPSGKLKRYISMLIIRSRGVAQELRRLSSNLNAASLWSGHNRSKVRDSERFRSHQVVAATAPQNGTDQTLLPLHLSFCRTTLKNDASGNEANGSVFFALRTVTIDPRSTWMGLRPSSVRYTG